MGAAISYMRRYSLASLVMVTQEGEDDDAESTVERRAETNKSKSSGDKIEEAMIIPVKYEERDTAGKTWGMITDIEGQRAITNSEEHIALVKKSMEKKSKLRITGQRTDKGFRLIKVSIVEENGK
jgi:hypothetical protein